MFNFCVNNVKKLIFFLAFTRRKHIFLLLPGGNKFSCFYQEETHFLAFTQRKQIVLFLPGGNKFSCFNQEETNFLVFTRRKPIFLFLPGGNTFSYFYFKTYFVLPKKVLAFDCWTRWSLTLTINVIMKN